MNVISFDICRTFVSFLPTSSSKKRLKLYSYYTWGFPLIIVLLANLIDRFPMPKFLESYKPNYAEKVCWINSKNASFLFFMLPVGSLLGENFIFFVLTVHGIHSKTFKNSLKKEKNDRSVVKDENRKEISKKKNQFLIYLKLSVIMGLTWLFGFLASFLEMPSLWYLFIIFNSLQGTFIFVFFDLKWKVYYTAYEKIMGGPHPDRTLLHLLTSNLPFTIQMLNIYSILCQYV